MADIRESIDGVVEGAERPGDRLNSVIAALVAVLATIMALFNIKDGNIVQAMAQAQAKSVSTWAYFQAKSTKQILAEDMLDQLVLERQAAASLSAEANAQLEQKILFYREKVQRYEAEKAAIRQQAEAYDAEYDRLNVHDDQFDIAEAGITVAIALLGVAALTRRAWLVGLALMFAAVGLVSGAAGFAGGDFHLDFLARMLG